VWITLDFWGILTYFRDIKPVLKTYLLENVVQRSCCFEGSAEERENKVEIVQKTFFWLFSVTLWQPRQIKNFRWIMKLCDLNIFCCIYQALHEWNENYTSNFLLENDLPLVVVANESTVFILSIKPTILPFSLKSF